MTKEKLIADVTAAIEAAYNPNFDYSYYRIDKKSYSQPGTADNVVIEVVIVDKYKKDEDVNV